MAVRHLDHVVVLAASVGWYSGGLKLGTLEHSRTSNSGLLLTGSVQEALYLSEGNNRGSVTARFADW